MCTLTSALTNISQLGAENPWTTWKALNRLRSQVGRSRVNMLKWGFSSEQETCDCGIRQTMQHLMVCPMMDTACSPQDLTTVCHISCGNVIWKRIGLPLGTKVKTARRAFGLTIDLSAPLKYKLNNNQPPPPFVCQLVLSRFRKCVKGHTFVSRITAATADNNTAKAAHRHDSHSKTHGNVRTLGEVTKRYVYFPWRSTHARGRVITGAFTFSFEI